MEDFLILLLQGFFELLLEIILNAPIYFWPGSTKGFGSPPWTERAPLSAGGIEPGPYSAAINCFWLLLLGGVTGGLSLAVFSHTFLSVPFLRIANLIYSPITSGVLACFIAKLRDQLYPWRRFSYAFFFTLGLTLIRFTYAHR